MIKPIETTYRGYRFRSRLEARWAVFFDCAEIPYQYEAQGYDVDGVAYLPDFVLPHQKMIVEIKPADWAPSPAHDRIYAIYCAGKIQKCGWRNSLWGDDLVDCDPGQEWTSRWIKLGGVEHTYTGPFFIGCDHGCGHGQNSHGYALGGGGCINLDEVFQNSRDASGNAISHNVDTGSRTFVHEQCHLAIDRSDVLYAFIDSRDCFGTIAEIGYAAARGKLVLLCFAAGMDFSDLWFVKQYADFTCEALAAIDGLIQLARWAGLIKSPPEEQDKINHVAQALGMKGIVLYGDPLDDGPTGPNWSRFCDDGGGAANAARRARFEHGDRP